MDRLLVEVSEVVSICAEARALAPIASPRDLPPSEIIPGVPAWHDFERKAWEMGEAVRQALSRKPALRRSSAVQRAILETARTTNLRRGRQAFVMALGFTAAAPLASELVPLILDPDVDGHVLDTLLKMRVHHYDAEARPLLDSEHAWIRRLARRYVVRCTVG